MSLNWWEDEEEEVTPSQGQSKGFAALFSQPDFLCNSCGSTTCYTDKTTTKLVCSECFTESDAKVNTDCDFEVTEAYAAKLGGNYKFLNAGRGSVTRRKPLDRLDRASTLPSADVCVEAMSLVIMKSAKKFAQQVLLKNSREERLPFIETVKELWLGYLHAWKKGADTVGRKFPELRISFRDQFLPANVRAFVVTNIAYMAMKKMKLEKHERKGDKPPPPVSSSVVDDVDPAVENTTTRKRKAHAKTTGTMVDSWPGRKDYKLAALKAPPSMNFVAALLWVGCSKAGITSFEVCQWTNNSPLLNALKILPPRLQREVELIRTFFTMNRAPKPKTLEDTATLLATACQMKVEGNWSQSNEEIKFYGENSIPVVVAKLVANAGLNKVILDDALALLGLRKSPVKPLKGISLDEFTRNEDFAAVIAVACIINPGWKTWKMSLSTNHPILPHTESQFHQLSYRGLTSYLEFVNQSDIFRDPKVWEGFDRLKDFCQTDGDDEVENKQGSHVMVDLSGGHNGHDDESRFQLLAGFLAYTIEGDIERIRTKIDRLVEIKRDMEYSRRNESGDVELFT